METALHQLVFRVEKVLDQQHSALGVFLDKERAFDNTSYHSMCVAVVKHAGGYPWVRWIRATLKGRLAAAILNGSSMGIAVSKVSPQ